MQMVLDSVTSPNTRRSSALALDELFAFSLGRALTRVLLQEWKASMEALSPSTINVNLSVVRRLVGEARGNGLISAEAAAHLSDIPNARQRGNGLGNWLTREQAKELLQVPDRSTLKGNRDLLGCALRRREMSRYTTTPFLPVLFMTLAKRRFRRTHKPPFMRIDGDNNGQTST
jgi:hypothetical protein